MTVEICVVLSHEWWNSTLIWRNSKFYFAIFDEIRDYFLQLLDKIWVFFTWTLVEIHDIFPKSATKLVIFFFDHLTKFAINFRDRLRKFCFYTIILILRFSSATNWSNSHFFTWLLEESRGFFFLKWLIEILRNSLFYSRFFTTLCKSQ